ncbi:MAG: MlaD family protein [Pseudonocardia sp.]
MSATNALLRHPVRSGLILLAIAAGAVGLVFAKPTITTALSPGETITIELSRDYKLQPNLSAVKIAGAKVGVVQRVRDQDDGPVLITLKVDRGTRALLGATPRAEVRPTTLLGGTYFVQLHPGGEPGEAASEVIPLERSGLPVELQQLLSAIPPDAQRSNQAALARLDETFQAGVGAPLTALLKDAPGGLRPTGVVVGALRGVNQDADLANLVTDLDRTTRELSATPGELRALVDSLAGTSRTFGANAAAFDRTIATLPATLRATRDGTGQLGQLLDRLTATADDARPTVRELDPVLEDLEPALDELRPVLDDLEPLLEDAEPLLDRLAPALDTTTDVLDDLDGPVLDRLNGPVLDAFLGEWKGFAPKYPQGGDRGTTMFQELGYVVTNAAGATQPINAGQHILAVWLGAGPTMVQGTGPLGQSLQDYVAEMYGPPHQKDPIPLGPSLPGGGKLPGPPGKSPVLPTPDSPLTSLGMGR